MENKRLPIVAVMLLLSIVNYSRIEGTQNIRTIEFLSIFTIGALTAVLIQGIIQKFKNK